jgi:ABC-type multidrug transport system fused ATPase/permease subunit
MYEGVLCTHTHTHFTHSQMQVDMVIAMGILFLSTVILILVLNPTIFIFMLPCVWYVISTRRKYLNSSREIKRIEAITRSPVQTHIATLLDGLTTIRSAGLQEAYKHKLAVAQNENTQGQMAYFYIIRWLGVRLDFVSGGVVVLTSSVFIAAALLNLQIYSAAFIGLAITQTLQLMGSFQMLIRQSSEVENQMTSVRRRRECVRVCRRTYVLSRVCVCG